MAFYQDAWLGYQKNCFLNVYVNLGINNIDWIPCVETWSRGGKTADAGRSQQEDLAQEDSRSLVCDFAESWKAKPNTGLVQSRLMMQTDLQVSFCLFRPFKTVLLSSCLWKAVMWEGRPFTLFFFFKLHLISRLNGDRKGKDCWEKLSLNVKGLTDKIISL